MEKILISLKGTEKNFDEERKAKMSRKSINISNLPDILFERLAKEDPKFESSSYLKRLQNLETNLERINMVYKQLQQHNLLPVFIKCEKSDSDAIKHREDGNKFFADHQYLKALESYTMSVVTSKSKESLAMTYASRSACLFKMKLYKECMLDVDRALHKNYYPDDLRPKLLDRQARAEKAYHGSERFYQDLPKIPPNKRNATIQCARNCVEIRKNQRYGRYVAASKEIQIGETICVEKAYAHEVKDAKLIHCHHCLELCYNPIPCPNCSFSLYCSEQCKNKARRTYHKYYCSLILTMIKYELEPLYFLSLKVAILSSKEFERLDEEEDEDPAQYRSDRYKEIHKLMSAVKEQSASDLFERTLGAVIMFHLLKSESSFFKENSISEDKFKELLLHQILVAYLNHLSIYESVQNENQNEVEMCGVGLYSFCSLLNHSCCPNVERFQYGSTNVLRAMKTIHQGEQLFVTYCLEYDALPVHFRQKFLRASFYFTCQCEACEHNWVLSEDSKRWSESLARDLKLSQIDAYGANLKLATGNVEIARKLLQHLIPIFKKYHELEPYGNAFKMRDLLSLCYRNLANKRRI